MYPIEFEPLFMMQMQIGVWGGLTNEKKSWMDVLFGYNYSPWLVYGMCVGTRRDIPSCLVTKIREKSVLYFLRPQVERTKRVNHRAFNVCYEERLFVCLFDVNQVFPLI